MSKGSVLKYRATNVPRQSGEVARIRVIKGADAGAIFVLKASSFTLGRGEEADLIIMDLKASRSHARIEYTKDGWIVSDLGSANGIFFQGEYIRKFSLRSGEHFTVGESILEFLGSHESTQILSAPMKDAREVERQDIALAQQKVRVQNMAQSPKVAKPAEKKGNSRTLLLLAIGGAAYFYLDQQQPPKHPASEKVAKKSDGKDDPASDRSLASYLPTAGVSKEVEKTADQYYWQGFREYLKGNFLRAKDNFELALQVNPAHDKAKHYLASAEKENNDEIKKLISSAKKAKLVGRYSEAKGYYETAMRHMYNDRSNPDYVECDEALKDIKTGADK